MKRIILALAALALATLSLRAQQPEMTAYAPTSSSTRRADLFTVLPIGPTDIVMLGNSITNGGEWAELFPGKPVKNRGISGDRTYHVIDRLDPIVAGKPAKLFLLIGVNDLGSGFTPEFAAENIAKIVDRFLTESPSTEVYVQSVMPVSNAFGPTYKHVEKNAEILVLNELIKGICAEKGVGYINIWPALADAEGKLDSSYTNDGLHLNGAGYLRWVEQLKPYVE